MREFAEQYGLAVFLAIMLGLPTLIALVAGFMGEYDDR